MEQFRTVLEKYSSHDNLRGTDKDTVHSYGVVYEQLLAKLADRPDLTILEIGILTGGFLQCLRELFPDAKIHGVDITLKHYLYDKGNVFLYEADATRRETAESIGQRFDLIIDDGSHLPEHQKQTLDVFAPYLKDDGIYVVEDIPFGSDKLRGELATIGRAHGLRMEWLDLTAQKRRFDDILAIFQREQ